MAINRYSGQVSQTQTIEPSNGVFTVDCSTGTDFFLNFNVDDYINESEFLPTYVGGQVGAISNSTSSWSVPLTGLTGGIASSPSEGDLVLVAYAVSTTNNANTNINYSISGYTKIMDEFESISTGYYTNLGVLYKLMGATPDQSISLQGVSNSFNSGAVAVHVWRNIDTSNPVISFNVAPKTGTVIPDLPQYITSIQETEVVVISAGAHSRGSVEYLNPGDLSNFISDGGTDNSDSSIGMGSISTKTATTVSPKPFEFNNASPINTDNSSIGVTLGLRPKSGFKKKYSSSIAVTNVPILKNDINISSAIPSLRQDDISVTWDFDLADASVGLASLPTSVSPGGSFSYGFYSQAGNIFLSKNNFFVESQRVQKTEIIKSTQEWTAPADVSQIEVLLCGGGGGGNTGSTTQFGGGGSALYEILDVTPQQSYLITIGAGGAAGSTGSPSSFGSILSISGGGQGRSPAGVGSPGASELIADTMTGQSSNDVYRRIENYSEVYGRGGEMIGSGNGAANTGSGGSHGDIGGSGVCVIKYWSSL